MGTATSETDTHEINVTKLPLEVASYVFDNRGNMTGKTDATGTTDYLWFYTDRLKRIEFPDASRHRYYYNGLGRRVLSKEDDKDDRRFVYDGWNVIGEKTEGSEEFVAYYTRGADMGGGIGGIISVHRNGTPAQYPDGYHTGDYFYHYNHRGDVVSVTDSTGAEVAHYRYDAYGNVVEKTGDFESPYQFSTKEYSSETGLIYYGYRFYMLEEGRWLKKDPLGYVDGWNPYGFLLCNPVNLLDPFGLQDSHWYNSVWDAWSDFVAPVYGSSLSYGANFWQEFYVGLAYGERQEGESYMNCVGRCLEERAIVIDIAAFAGSVQLMGYIPKPIGYSPGQFFHGGRACYRWANQFGSGVKAFKGPWQTGTAWTKMGWGSATLNIAGAGLTGYAVGGVSYCYIQCVRGE